ncbi:MAG: MiaB/RimO family radical SAM methylthiotransferase, partial [Lachnospiraceae bacterium]|nr:MiaB/RimO family radical SAM methylthiotransferase [Lachnospiraceae bacterium]
NESAAIIAAGCYIQALSNEERDKLGFDGYIGTNHKGEVVEIVEEILKGKNVQQVSDMLHECNYENISLEEKGEHTRTYIKIQDGCNQFCSYCIIPYTRGRVRSRNPEDVVAEAERMVELGYEELVLTGIHLSSYEAYGEKGGNALLKLMEELSGIERLKRIRLGSLEPRVVTQEFAEKLSSLKKVCPQFHLSLQSGSDTVLRRMNRKYSTEEYLAGVRALKTVYDRPAITTDIIVGFPGETDEEFKETIEFTKKVAFSKVHVFQYSRRKGTKADTMPDQVSEQIKKSRSGELIAHEEKLGQEYAESFIGEPQNILVEEIESIDGKDYYTGYNERYIRCATMNKAGEGVAVKYKNNILFLE